MPKEIQTSDSFNPYVWIQSRNNNGSHIMQEGIWGSAKSGIHLVRDMYV
jgi:hypothetical protein